MQINMSLQRTVVIDYLLRMDFFGGRACPSEDWVGLLSNRTQIERLHLLIIIIIIMIIMIILVGDNLLAENSRTLEL